LFGVSNPPKSPDSSVEDPETISDMLVVALLLLIPKVPLSLIFDPTGGGYALVVPRALDILPILTSDPVDGITPIVYK
jgi:hypothetical protein